MPDYLVFGGCLRSELPFPELAEAGDCEPTWNLRLASLPSDEEAEVLTDSRLSASCRIRVSRYEGRLRFFHSCAGTFEFSADGSDIVFDAERAVDTNAARTDFVARLLLMCADQERVTWLHGSAVRIGDSAIAFVGPSGAGKSTLSLALARAGAKHICDDTLPIEAGNPPVTWPSDWTIRLHDDSRARLASGANSVRRESDGKFIVTHESIGTDAVDSGAECRAPLVALYLLAPAFPSPFAGDGGTCATRRLIHPTAAMPALIQHLKLGILIGRDYPAKTMKSLAAIVASVPVFELKIVRDWSTIDEVVGQIYEWHGETPSRVASSVGASA
jgi:hypothetical protein